MAGIKIISSQLNSLLGLTLQAARPETDPVVARLLGVVHNYAHTHEMSVKQAVAEICHLNNFQSAASVAGIQQRLESRERVIAMFQQLRARGAFNQSTVLRGVPSAALKAEPASSGFEHRHFEGVLLRNDLKHLESKDLSPRTTPSDSASLRETFDSKSLIPFKDKLNILEEMLTTAGLKGTIYISISAQNTKRQPPFFVIDIPEFDTQILSSNQRGATAIIIKGRMPITELTCDIDPLLLKQQPNVRSVDFRDVETFPERVLHNVRTPLAELPEQIKSRFHWQNNPKAAKMICDAFELHKSNTGERPKNDTGLLIDPITGEAISTWQAAYQALRKGIDGLQGIRSLRALEGFINERNVAAQVDRAEHSNP
jgi:hypothetical protein